MVVKEKEKQEQNVTEAAKPHKKVVNKKKFASIITCAAGMKAKIEPLKLLTDQVYSLDTMDSSSFKTFFKWVSDLIEVGNKSVGATDDLILPPPPEEVNVVI